MARITKPSRRKNRGNSEARRERQQVYQTKRWKQLRISKLYDDPLCELCLSHGVRTPAEDVHHVISFMSTDDKYRRHRLAYDRNNLQSLCRACHQYQHHQVGEESTPWGQRQQEQLDRGL